MFFSIMAITTNFCCCSGIEPLYFAPHMAKAMLAQHMVWRHSFSDNKLHDLSKIKKNSNCKTKKME